MSVIGSVESKGPLPCACLVSALRNRPTSKVRLRLGAKKSLPFFELRPAAPRAMVNCPNVLLQGTCSDIACQYTHNVHLCELCNLIFPTPSGYQDHLATPAHQNRARGTSVLSHCPLCDLNIGDGEAGWRIHIGGKRHAKAARREGVPAEIPRGPPSSTQLSKLCELCQAVIPLTDWSLHVEGRKHQSRETFTRYKSAIEEAETDKNGVSVEGEFDFGFIEPSEATHGVKRTATVSTSVPRCKCVVTGIRLASSQGQWRVGSAYVSNVQRSLRM